jgi:hypothetical protein
VKKTPKNVAHFVGKLKKLRSETRDKKQFVTHISSGNWLACGLGLVFWKINKIKTRKPDGECEFFLSCRYAEKLCPRKRGEKIITRVLQDAGIITVISPGVKDRKPAHYRLESDWVGILPMNFKLNAWQRHRLAAAEQWVRDRCAKKNPVLMWVDASISRIQLPETETWRNVMRDSELEPSARRAGDFLRGYRQGHSKIGYAGTIYTPIHSLPKTVLPTLLIDGEPIAQLDITSAHPSTLPRLMIEAEKKFKVLGGIEEAKKLTEELESGRLYDSLAITLGIAPKAAKKRFLAALNGEDKHTYNDAVFLEFARRFPVAKEAFGKIRRGDRKRLNRKMAGILADVIKLTIETCAKLELPVYPRTDEIVCRQRDEAKVHEILSAYFLDQTSVHAKVGGRRVSFIPAANQIIGYDHCPQNASRPPARGLVIR